MKLRSLLRSSAAVLATAGVACAPIQEGAPDTNESAVSGVPIGEVRGVVDVSNTFRTRLLDESDPQTVSFDVSRVAGPVFRLRRQLGVFATEGTATTYQGGLPTPLRTTLWHQIMGRTATALGTFCTQPFGVALTFASYAQGPTGAMVRPMTFRLHVAAAEKLTRACALAGDEPMRRKTAGDLFDVVMGRGSTLAEDRSVFVDEFAADGSPNLASTPQERVTNMALAMLLNPHFLLAK